jgi:hypothetical protein
MKWAIILMVLFPLAVSAADAPPAAHSDTDAAVSGAGPDPVVATDNALEVRGQNRASSLMIFKKEKFQIKFIRIRKDYSDEILNTPY